MVSVSGELGEGLNNLMHAMLKEKLMPLETVVEKKVRPPYFFVPAPYFFVQAPYQFLSVFS
jgi:hypothetical protein